MGKRPICMKAFATQKRKDKANEGRTSALHLFNKIPERITFKKFGGHQFEDPACDQMERVGKNKLIVNG